MSVPHLLIIYMEEIKMPDEQKCSRILLTVFLGISAHLLKCVITWSLMTVHPCYSVLICFPGFHFQLILSIVTPIRVKGPPFPGVCSLTLLVVERKKKRKCKFSALFGVTKAYTLGKASAFLNFNTYLGERNQSQMCSSKKYIFTLLKCFSPPFSSS